MTKKRFEKAVFELFGIKADYPFDEDFETAVFRHPDTKKWFAICMNIKRTKLGLTGEGELWIVNLKCEPEIIESLAGVEVGIFRAYHMNKNHWLTASLDMCDEDMIVWLLEKSYALTKK
jgi:predicted DNA-binding protein (MmcQ/YjbR family)